jgi:predicted transcriptional regulator
LTKRQQAIFEFYRHNPCSTYKEASKQLWISDVAIYKHVLKMEKEGHLNRDIWGKVYISLNNLFKTVKEWEKQSN